MERTARNAEAARLLAGWGHLLQAGVDEAEALAALGEQAQDPGLQALLRAAAPDPRRLAAALEAHGEALDSWVVVLLGVAPRSGAHLLAAAALLERGASWSRALLWARLALLRAAGAAPGEAFGALAREARDHGKANLAEGLYAAAKRARTGSSFLEALRPSAAQLAPAATLVVLAAREATLPAALAALEGLAAAGAGEATAPAAGAPSGDSGRLQRPAPGIVDHAAAGAAPLKRGLERVLSGIEEALGIGGPDAEKTARARELLAGRAQRTDGPEARPQARPQPPAPVPPAPAAPPAPADPEAEPEPRRKTIGMDSGPVPKVGYTTADMISADRPPAPPRPLTREEWVLALDAARGQLAVLELQPGDAPLARALERELERLRAAVPGGDRRLLEQLDDLALRLMTWRQRQ